MDKITNLIHEYINTNSIVNESNKKKDTEKLIKVINSVENEKHVEMVVNYIHLYVKRYGQNSFFENLTLKMWKEYDMDEKYEDQLIFKLQKLEHEGKIEKGFVSKMKKKYKIKMLYK